MKIRVVLLSSLLLGSAQLVAAQSAPLPPEVLFAREYVRLLQDSGAVGVIPMTAEKTRALKGYAPNIDALRADMASAQTTIALDRWGAVPAKGNVPPLFLVVFKVEGIAKPLDLSLWVEEVTGRYLLNTIMARPSTPKED